jgi:hypothetical protein
MQNAIHSACRREKTQQNANNEGEEELPGVEEAVRRWSGCFAGGAAAEAGGGVVAHGRRLQTVILLFPAAEREILPLPLSSIFFSFFLSLFRLPVVVSLSSRFCFLKNFPSRFQASP